MSALWVLYEAATIGALLLAALILIPTVSFTWAWYKAKRSMERR